MNTTYTVNHIQKGPTLSPTQKVVRIYEVDPDCYEWTASGAGQTVKASTWTGQMSKGLNQSIEFTVVGKRDDCASCMCTASTNNLVDVHELSVANDLYLGLDRTDFGRTNPVVKVAAALINPEPTGSSAYSWTNCGICSFTGWTDWATARYFAPDPDNASTSYLAETLTVRGTATNAEGQFDSANCTTNFTIVKVDVTIGGVGEDKEETEGAFIPYVADATNGFISVEGTNKLVLVRLICEPGNLPTNETVRVMCAGPAELYQRLSDGKLVRVVSTNYFANEISNLEFVLHGHNASGACKDGLIKIEHLTSGAVDLAKFTNVKLRVTNIKFNHNTSSSDNDAINIRRSFADSIDVSNGEWFESNGVIANEPCCYTTNRAATVKVRFESSGFITSAVIWATCAGACGSLSSLMPTNVAFSGGVSSPEYVEFSMERKTLSAIDCSKGGVLGWQALEINGGSDIPCEMNASGPHIVYTILDEPKPPWKNAYGEQENAWTNALELACQWACGAATEHQAASSITIGVNASGRFQYEVKKGEAKYVDGANVELTEFISRVNGGDGLGADVNCTDCAAFVVSLSNLIGCELYSSRMGYDFDTRPYTAIGRDSFAPPSWGWGFSYHEVAWSGGCQDGDHVYDACLRVDDTCSPNVSDRSETIPAGMVFSDGSPNAPFAYRECLTPSTLNGYYRCISRPERRIRRGIK